MQEEDEAEASEDVSDFEEEVGEDEREQAMLARLKVQQTARQEAKEGRLARKTAVRRWGALCLFVWAVGSVLVKKGRSNVRCVLFECLL